MGLNRKTGKQKYNGRSFPRKPHDKFLYTWKPQDDVTKKTKGRVGARPPFCNATPFSQGEDFLTTYTYEQVYTNGEEQRYAYVECDYVQ